jgi:hypothetical protein
VDVIFCKLSTKFLFCILGMQVRGMIVQGFV